MQVLVNGLKVNMNALVCAILKAIGSCLAIIGPEGFEQNNLHQIYSVMKIQNDQTVSTHGQAVIELYKFMLA